MSNPDFQGVLRLARELPGRQADGRPAERLHGRHLALICESDSGPDARLFRRAVEELGGHVTHIRTSRAGLDDDGEVNRIARMLGRLYVAVECQGTARSLPARLERASGIPAFDGIATAQHPSAGLVDELPDDVPVAERRLRVVQALLLNALG